MCDGGRALREPWCALRGGSSSLARCRQENRRQVPTVPCYGHCWDCCDCGARATGRLRGSSALELQYLKTLGSPGCLTEISWLGRGDVTPAELTHGGDPPERAAEPEAGCPENCQGSQIRATGGRRESLGAGSLGSSLGSRRDAQTRRGEHGRQQHPGLYQSDSLFRCFIPGDSLRGYYSSCCHPSSCFPPPPPRLFLMIQ